MLLISMPKVSKAARKANAHLCTPSVLVPLRAVALVPHGTSLPHGHLFAYPSLG